MAFVPSDHHKFCYYRGPFQKGKNFNSPVCMEVRGTTLLLTIFYRYIQYVFFSENHSCGAKVSYAARAAAFTRSLTDALIGII